MRRLFLVSLALAVAAGAAVTGTAAVEVVGVEFRGIGEELSGEEWYEATVVLDVSRDREESGRGSRFEEELEVSLSIGIEVDGAADGRRFEFFHADARPVALETGRAHIRFYLPPEIVDRDRVRGDPHSFVVEAWREDTLLASQRSPSLNAETALASFRSRLQADRTRNDGILRPQDLSPFRDYYPRETPTFKVVPGNR